MGKLIVDLLKLALVLSLAPLPVRLELEIALDTALRIIILLDAFLAFF